MNRRSILSLSAITALVLAVLQGSAASAQTNLKVIVFPGLSNLAQFAAQSQGYYSKRGLAIELINTPNSDELRNGLAAGRYQIAHGAVDNAVFQVENDKTDLFIFMGGNNGFNNLFTQPEIASYEQLRGKTMAVDAVDTAFALLMYKMLDVRGVKRSEYEVKAIGGTPQRLAAMTKDKTYAAAILDPPFSISAQKSGLKDLGSAVSVVGPYQSLTLADKQKGYAVDAKFDMDGFRNVLKLRAEILGTWGGKPPAPDKFVDFSYSP